jgi:FtsH-binding integral membrane protein
MTALSYPIAAQASETERAAFIRRTYTHLAGAVLVFIGLEALLVNIPGIEGLVGIMFASPISWLVVLGLAMGAGMVARMWAASDASPGTQYLGLGLYVVVQAVVFLPLLYIAQHFCGDYTIAAAGVFTLAIFAGLTLAVFVTGTDFSYLRPILCCAGFLAIGLIVCACIFPSVFSLGIWFSFAMVGLSCAYIIYYTSNVLHHYRTDQHVGAALALFAAVALLFWYVLQIFMSRSR